MSLYSSVYLNSFVIISLFLHSFYVVSCIFAAMITQFPSEINKVSLILVKTSVLETARPCGEAAA